jgi:hypothetical protein
MSTVRWFMVLCILTGCSGTPLHLSALPKTPEGPTGNTSCTDLRDNNQNTLLDASDTDCSASAAFVSAGGGYAAKAMDLLRAGPWTTVVDPSTVSGSYAYVPLGNHAFTGELAGSGMGTGTFYIWALVNIPSASTNNRIWTKASATPFLSTPSNTDGALLNNGQATGGWSWVPIGQFASLTGQTGWQSGIMATNQRTMTFATGDLFRWMSVPDIRYDCFFLHTSPSATPQCPTGGGGGGGTVDYTILGLGANVVGNNTTEESFWVQANDLNYTGFDSGVTGTSISTRLVWKAGTPDRLCFLHKETAANLTSPGTADDNSGLTGGTGIDLRRRTIDQTRVRDAQTYLYANDLNPYVYDGNYPSGSFSSTFDVANGFVTAFYSANALRLKGCFDLPDNVTAGDVGLFESTIREKVGTAAATVKHWKTTTSSASLPAQWGTVLFSATDIVGPGDSTPPTVGTISFTNVTATSLTAKSTTNESASCSVRYDTDNDNAISGADASASMSCGASVGGTCTCNLTGLSAATAYEVQITAIDAAGNAGVSNVGDQTTLSAGTTRYISPTGTNSGGCTISGSPCKTFAFVLPLMNPGETLILKNGTYDNGTTGLPGIDCSKGIKNGTASQRITMRAENERQARINGYVSGKEGLLLRNCSYWTIQGLTIAKRAFSTDEASGSTYPAIGIYNSPNFEIKRNLTYADPGGDASCWRGGVSIGSSFPDGSDNGLVEENEFYNHARNSPSVKYNSGITFRRNYVTPRNATPCTAGNTGPISSFILYPGQNHLLENNIAEQGEGSFACISYDRNTDKKNCHDNKWLGNIAIRNGKGFGMSQASTELSNANTMPLNNTFEHNLAYRLTGSNKIGTGFSLQSSEGTIGKNLTAIGYDLGIYPHKHASTPTSGFFSADFTNIMVLNNNTGFKVTTDIDDWSVTNLRANGNSTVNYAATANNSCTNCTGVSTTNPNIGSCTVYTGLTVGAEILYKYQKGVLTTNKLWTTTAPSGYTGTSYPYYFSGCGTVVSGINSDPDTSCVGVASRLQVTSACLPPGY